MRDRVLSARIGQIEYSLPEKRETNEDLFAENPDWEFSKIFEKTGISCRYVSAPGQTASDLCVDAAQKLFRSGAVSPDDIDTVLFCTQSPDYALPTTACIIQDRLQLPKRTAAFDVNQGCSGFVYGLAIAGSMIESGISENLLLLCGETYTKYIDIHDRTNRPIFSDAGAAIWVQRTDGPLLGPFDLGTDGSGHRNLMAQGSGARAWPSGTDGKIRLKMDGASVFLFTMATVPQSVRGLLKVAGVGPEEIDLFFFHQASRLVLDDITRTLCLPEEKVVRDLESLGNTVSATIPIALKRAADSGRLRPGHRVMLVGFGVGYSWGSCLLRWE